MQFDKNAFLRLVDRTHECWHWLGSKSGNYGHYKNQTAHRVSYQIYNGDIPEGLVIDHLCGNPICVNPLHLQAVTPHVNTLRSCKRLLACIHRDKRQAPCDLCVEAQITAITQWQEHGRSKGYYSNRKWRLNHPDRRSAQNKRYYSRSMDALNGSDPWPEAYSRLVLAHVITDQELSRLIGRSVKAIQLHRHRIKGKK